MTVPAANFGALDPAVAPVELGELLQKLEPLRRDELRRRISLVLEALDRSSGAAVDQLEALAESLDGADPERIWLGLAVLTGNLPDRTSTLAVIRNAKLEGPLRALGQAVQQSGLLDADTWPEVELVTEEVVVDVHYTSRTQLATGIQRVARETVRRWQHDHEPVLVRWRSDYRGMCRLTADEERRAVRSPESPRPEWIWTRDQVTPDPGPDQGQPSKNAVIVPWRCTIVVPELAIERDRIERYEGLALCPGTSIGVIGFDCVPLTASETCLDEIVEDFARHLAGLAHFDRVAAISLASCWEYTGWRSMLGASGRIGPAVRAYPLPVEAPEPAAAVLEQARELFIIGPLPMVLVVGSHEPRKNHLPVLHAAETLWREGLYFSLSFVGGGTWKSEDFSAQVEALQVANRPVQAIRTLPDELLWAGYRLAHCTVFISVHEGFGLPLAESLASGTPAITSDFGSMADTASHGGALLVDPWDDTEVTGALRRILLDHALRDRLAAEARALTWSTWDDYAKDTWTFLVEAQEGGP